MASGGSSKSYGESKSKPWAEQAPYLKQLYEQAQGLYGQGNYEYGPDRVQGFDPAQKEALGMAETRGREGSDLTRAAQGEATATLRGDYLNPESNPNLQRFSEIGERNITRGYYGALSGLGSSYEGANRTGGGNMASRADVMREGLATGLGDFNAQLYGGAYEGERGRMMGAMGQANNLADQDYRDISSMMTAGSARQEQSQRGLDDLVGRFLQRQYGNAEKLSEFSGMLGQPVMTNNAYNQAKSSNWSALWG